MRTPSAVDSREVSSAAERRKMPRSMSGQVVPCMRPRPTSASREASTPFRENLRELARDVPRPLALALGDRECGAAAVDGLVGGGVGIEGEQAAVVELLA